MTLDEVTTGQPIIVVYTTGDLLTAFTPQHITRTEIGLRAVTETGRQVFLHEGHTILPAPPYVQGLLAGASHARPRN